VGAVVVLVPETEERIFSDPFFPLAYQGALSAFRGTGIHVLLSMAHPDDGVEPMLAFVLSDHADGAIVVSHHGQDFARTVAASPQPVVFVGNPGVPGAHYVDIDGVQAAATATRHLIQRGAKVIGTVTGPMDMGSGIDRLRGFRLAMREAGRGGTAVAEGDYTILGGERAAYELLRNHPDLDGLFVASDLMASGALRAASRLGRSVPDDLLVVGFDDSVIATQTTPTLTTMENRPDQLAEAAGRMLLDKLNGRDPRSPVILPSRLIVRESA
jgi:DNA-binding LacI/PurR family transcriptional regulator